VSDDLPFIRDFVSLIHQPSPEEILATREPIPFILDRRIPCGKVAIFAGAGGGGKSSILVGLALARATGRKFLGLDTRPGATLVLSAEDNVTDYLRKVDAWREVYPALSPQDIARNLQILPLVGEDFRFVSGRFGNVRVEIERVDQIAIAARAMVPQPDLIIVETASRFGAGDENSNESAAALIAACERLASHTGAAVLIVAHVGKTAARESTIDAYSARGASAFVDNARAALVLGTISQDRAKRLGLTAEEAENLLVLATPKSNFAPRAGDLVLERIETPHGLVLRPYEGGGMSLEEATRASIRQSQERRASNGQRLRTVVENLTASGVMVSFAKLRDDHRAAVAFISIRDLKETIEHAISDGYLTAAQGPKRGQILLPGSMREVGSVGSSRIVVGSDPSVTDDSSRITDVLSTGSARFDPTRNDPNGGPNRIKSDHGVPNGAGNSPNIPPAEIPPNISESPPWT
jgi:hypothetical protein